MGKKNTVKAMENKIEEKPKCYLKPFGYIPSKCCTCPHVDDCLGAALKFFNESE